MKIFQSVCVILGLLISVGSFAQKNQNINIQTSQIKWEGKKVLGAHEGTINFKAGSVTTKEGKLTGGSFTVDMLSVVVTDLEAGQGKENLEGHLKSDDFFGVENYSESKLVFKNVKYLGKNQYKITADLTIKGKTNPVEFDATFNGKEGMAKVTVDRTKYDIKYGSGSFFDNLGDKAINNDFTLNIAIKL